MEELYNSDGWRITKESAQLLNGGMKKISRVHRASSVHVIAFTKQGRILVIREYRPFYAEHLWMIPSGKMDKEKDMLVAAQRELQEETGYEAKKLGFWFSAHHSESLVMANYFFIAHDLVKNPLPQDEDEVIEVHELPLEEALKNILSSPKVHIASALAVLRCMQERKK